MKYGIYLPLPSFITDLPLAQVHSILSRAFIVFMIICALGIPTCTTLFRRHYKIRAIETNSGWFTCAAKPNKGLFASKLTFIKSWKDIFFFVCAPTMPFKCS